MNQCMLGLTPEMLSAWQSHLLTPAEQDTIAAHIPHCATCQQTLEIFGRFSRMVRKEPRAAFSSQDVWDALLRHIIQEDRNHVTTPKRMNTIVGVVAIAALIIGFTVVLARLPGNKNTTPSASPTTTAVIASPSVVVTHVGTATPTPTPVPPSPTPTVAPLTRIHNASPDSVPLYARITYTITTTYNQAVALLPNGATWNCDGIPRTPFPANYIQTLYTTSHMLWMSYPTWDVLVQIASSPYVTSVDGEPGSPCP